MAGQPWRYLIREAAQTLLVIVAVSPRASPAALSAKDVEMVSRRSMLLGVHSFDVRLLPLPTGTVKWFNAAKGYGFIQPEGGGPDAFVHISAVERAGLDDLKEGQRVRYELVRGQNGKSSAENLQLVR